MSTIGWSSIVAASLVAASGCSEGPGKERKLIPVQSERGLVTYRYEDELEQWSSLEAAARPPVPSRIQPISVENRRGDEQAYRDMIAHRENQRELMRQRQEQLRDERASLDATRSFQAERALLEPQRRLGLAQERAAEQRSMREQAASAQAAQQRQQVEQTSRWLREHLRQQEQQLRQAQLHTPPN